MIHTQEDFYNKTLKEVRKTYFKDEEHGRTENENYHKTTYTVELFNNGCLTYRKLIGRLAKACNETTKNMHELVSKYIISFGEYEYKPS